MKEQLGTRLDAPLRLRLRVYAAVSGQQVTEVVSAALDGYLPPLAEIVQAAASGSEATPPRDQLAEMVQRTGQSGHAE
jgi:hypothetical protein